MDYKRFREIGVLNDFIPGSERLSAAAFIRRANEAIGGDGVASYVPESVRNQVPTVTDTDVMLYPRDLSWLVFMEVERCGKLYFKPTGTHTRTKESGNEAKRKEEEARRLLKRLSTSMFS